MPVTVFSGTVQALVKEHRLHNKVESVLRFLNAKKTMKLGRAVDWKIPKEQISKLAYAVLADPEMPDFARVDLRNLLQAIWTVSSKKAANVSFLPGQVFVSVKGGDVVTGGAPLNLIVEKVQTIQAMFYRTIEVFVYRV